MPSVRLSNEALKYLRQAKNQKSSSEGFKQFISAVHDEEESDVESEDDEPALVLTPRLKAHSRRIVESYSDGADTSAKEIQPIPVSNLSKRFSSANLGTPSRILQLALEKKFSNESHETTAEEPPVSNSDTEIEVAVEQPAHAETNKRIPASRKKAPMKAQETSKATSENEADFKVPREPRGKKNMEPSEKQTKPTKTRGNKKKQEVDTDASDVSATPDDYEPPAKVYSRRKPRQGQKDKENPRKPIAALMSPAELAAVKVTLENDPTAGTRRDVSLRANASNVSRSTANVDDTIDSVVATVSGKTSPVTGRGLRSSRNKKSPSKRVEASEDNMPAVNTRKGRSKKAETSPVKRPARNKRGGKAPLATPAQDDEEPEVMMQSEPSNDDVRSDATNQVVPDFSSDHEEDRTPSSSPSRDSPILSKTSRLSAALEKKSVSSDDSSESSLPPSRKRLSTVHSRSSSSSPDMFSPTPHKGEVEKHQEAKPLPNSAKVASHLSDVPADPHSAVTRARRRASIGVVAKSSLVSDAPPTPSSSGESTPLQLEAVGLVRKPTPQSDSKFRTPPRRSMLPPVATPLSSRSRVVQAEKAPEPPAEVKEQNASVKRKQTVTTPRTSPKRQRMHNSPKKPQESAKLETPQSTSKRAQLVSPENLPGPSNAGTPKSSSKRQRVQKPSPHKLSENVNIYTEETLPCLANADIMEFSTLGVKAITVSTNKEQPSSSRRAEEIASQLAIFNRPNTTENAPSGHPPSVETARFNPYLAPPEDPVRASLLLATDEFRVTWLHILPKCSFYFRVYSPTVVMLISGIILISGDANQSGLVLSPKSRVAELNVGSLCQAINTGSTRAIFQITESLS